MQAVLFFVHCFFLYGTHALYHSKKLKNCQILRLYARFLVLLDLFVGLSYHCHYARIKQAGKEYEHRVFKQHERNGCKPAERGYNAAARIKATIST